MGRGAHHVEELVGVQREVLGILPEREFFIDNLPVRIHFSIVMIRWTGLAPWEFDFPLDPAGVPRTVSSVKYPVSSSSETAEKATDNHA